MIPEHWRSIQLEHVGTWGSGGTPRRGVDGYYGGPIPWLKIGDLTDGPTGESEEKITERAIAESSAKLIPAGAVLVAMYGSIGKLGIATAPLTTNQAIAFCVPNTRQIGSLYLFYWLMSQRTALFRMGKGGTQLNISQTVLRGLSMPLAPLPDQHRIVAAIETHFSRLDAAVASLTRAKANVKRARASVLKAAVEGRLVPTEAALARAEGRPYEPASVLLDRILAERKAAWAASGARGKYQEPVKPETEGLPGLPEGWCRATLEQIGDGARPFAYGVLVPGPDVPDGVPFVRVGDIGEGQVADRPEKSIARAVADKFKRTYLQGGELLLSIVGTIGRVGIASERLKGANVARAVGVLPLGDSVSSQFVVHAIRSPATKHRLAGAAHEVARKTLNMEDVRAASVPLPPLPEQHRIVAEVDRRLSVLDALDTTLDANLARCARLRQAILKRAFEGRLVPAEPANAR